MDKDSETNRTAGELSEKVAVSREHVEYNLRNLTSELDFIAKLRRSYLHYTLYWIGGALAAGTLIALLPMREKKVYVSPEGNRKTKHQLAQGGMAIGVLNLAASLIRPVIAEFAKNRLSQTVRGFRSA
jgi:hypothetical protein